jgi:hypothetical protein
MGGLSLVHNKRPCGHTPAQEVDSLINRSQGALILGHLGMSISASSFAIHQTFRVCSHWHVYVPFISYLYLVTDMPPPPVSLVEMCERPSSARFDTVR